MPAPLHVTKRILSFAQWLGPHAPPTDHAPGLDLKGGIPLRQSLITIHEPFTPVQGVSPS